MNIPEFQIEDLAESYADFYNKLYEGSIPMPCWVIVGHEGFKVTKENHKALTLGMNLNYAVADFFKGK